MGISHNLLLRAFENSRSEKFRDAMLLAYCNKRAAISLSKTYFDLTPAEIMELIKSLVIFCCFRILAVFTSDCENQLTDYQNCMNLNYGDDNFKLDQQPKVTKNWFKWTLQQCFYE